MIYVVSDLHGYSLRKFKKILSMLSFSLDDSLYVLGDVIDRGLDGINLLKFFMSQPNIQLILGNHEAMFLACDFLFDGDVDIAHLYGFKYNAYATWVSNGGLPTINAISAMRDSEIKFLLSYLNKAPLYKEIDFSGKQFVLTHSGFGAFEKDKNCPYILPKNYFGTDRKSMMNIIKIN